MGSSFPQDASRGRRLSINAARVGPRDWAAWQCPAQKALAPPQSQRDGAVGGGAAPLRSTVPGGTLEAKLKESLKTHPGVSRRRCARLRPAEAKHSQLQGVRLGRLPPPLQPCTEAGGREGGCPAQGHTARTAGRSVQGRLPVHAPHCSRVARSQGGRVCGGQDTLPRLQPRLPHWGEGLGWLGQPNFQKKLKVQTISCEIFHYLKDVFQSHRLWPPGQALVWNCRPLSTVRWRLQVFRVRKGLDSMSEWMFTRHVLVVIS